MTTAEITLAAFAGASFICWGLEIRAHRRTVRRLALEFAILNQELEKTECELEVARAEQKLAIEHMREMEGSVEI